MGRSTRLFRAPFQTLETAAEERTRPGLEGNDGIRAKVCSLAVGTAARVGAALGRHVGRHIEPSTYPGSRARRQYHSPARPWLGGSGLVGSRTPANPCARCGCLVSSYGSAA